MSENKKNKDSYAQDTLAFTVPPEERRRSQNRQHYEPQYGNQPHQQNNQYPQEYYEQYPHNYAAHPSVSQEQQYYNNPGNYPQQYPPNQNGIPRQPQGQRPQNPNSAPRQSQGQHPQNPNGAPRQPQGGQRPQNPNGAPRQPQVGQRPQNPNGAPRQSQGQRPQNHNGAPRQSQEQRPQTKKRNQVQAQKQNTRPVKQKKRKKGGIVKKLIISLLSILIVLFIIYSAISFYLISKVNVNDRGERIQPSHSLYSDSAVRNILLIGTDSRGEDRGRSDSMILLSINRKTNKMSLVSLMRDSYVQIPGYGSDKLNAAYSYGGPELLMDTIEENFYIEIDDYFTVNFISFANIVNAVGGVEIEVTDDEADAINVLLDSPEGNTLFGTPDESDYLNGGGTYKLNGKQALCYSRLRYVGNADFERTQRQRKVLTEILKNLGKANPFKLGATAKDILPSMDTNMSKFSMYLLSLRVPSFLIGYDTQQLRIPAEDTFSGSTIDGQSVLEIDFDANIEIIEEELY